MESRRLAEKNQAQLYFGVSNSKEKLDIKKELVRLKNLLELAKERDHEEIVVHAGGWDPDPRTVSIKVATLTSSASYDRATRIAKRILRSDDLEAIAELSLMFAEDPMNDIGQSDRVIHETIRKKLDV